MAKKKILSRIGKKREPISQGKWKGLKNQRQGEIFRYVKKELYKSKLSSRVDVASEWTPKQKETYAQAHYQTWKINKEQRNYILKETARLYREERESKRGQLLWYQEQTGFTKPNPQRIIKKQKIKGIFYQSGEHKIGKEKNKTLKQIWSEKVLKRKGSIKGSEVEKLTQELYWASPRRLRDRFLTTTNRRTKSTGINDLYQKFVKNNPVPATQPYYRKALYDFVRSQEKRGEEVPDEEVEVDKYSRVILKEGQWLRLDSDKPGKGWTVIKNVPSLEDKIREKFHGAAQKELYRQEATTGELNYFSNKKDLTLCSMELHENISCQESQGTSHPWCLFCVKMGARHPPLLRKWCPYAYTYKKYSCGTKQDPNANLQWHFSLTGSRTQVAGNDWGGCHIGIFSKPKPKRKSRRWK